MNIPFTYTLGRLEAGEEYCRSHGIHPHLWKPVQSWPNLVEPFDQSERKKLMLLYGWSEVEDHERIIQRARERGFEIVHA